VIRRRPPRRSLGRARVEGDCGSAVAALGVHAALGAGHAAVELWRTTAPACCAVHAARRAADVALAEAALARAARDWRAFEAPGVEALLALRPRFVEARRRRELEAALGAGARPPAADEDWVGPRRRAATDAPGPAVQVAVAARAGRARGPDADADPARPARTVFVENLPPDATAGEVAAAFARAGAVADVELFARAAPAAAGGATAAGNRRRGRAAAADGRAPYRLRLSAPARSATAPRRRPRNPAPRARSGRRLGNASPPRGAGGARDVRRRGRRARGGTPRAARLRRRRPEAAVPDDARGGPAQPLRPPTAAGAWRGRPRGRARRRAR